MTTLTIHSTQDSTDTIVSKTWIQTPSAASLPVGITSLDSGPKYVAVLSVTNTAGTGRNDIYLDGAWRTSFPYVTTQTSAFSWRVYRPSSSAVTFGYDSGGGGSMLWDDGTTYASSSCLSGSLSYCTVATAPATLTVAQTGKNFALTATASSSAGGGTISSYKVQYRTSTDGTTWGAWGNTQTMTSLAYTYSGLPVATYYQFRAYATNQAGNSPAQTVATTYFVSSGGRVYDGTTWKSATIFRVYDGTTWKDATTARVYDGTTWKDITI